MVGWIDGLDGQRVGLTSRQIQKYIEMFYLPNEKSLNGCVPR